MSGSSGEEVVLVLAPHATRSGSTQVLIDLLTRVRAEGSIPLRIELLSGGSCADELRALAPPRAADEVVHAVLANSVLAAEALARLPDRIATAVYVHEPAEVLASLPEVGRRQLRDAELVLCVTESVRADVLAVGVAPDRARVLPPIVPPITPPPAELVAAARAAAGAEPGDRLVVGCGEASWRKGTDLFVEAAARLAARPDVRFAWVGRRLRPFSRLLDLGCAAAGLDGRLRWVGDVEDAAPFLAASDVLLVPSRYDPQPLVAAEASLLGTPTVAFAVGGLASLGAAGAALVAPFPDVPTLADLVTDLLDDRERADSVAAAGRTWVHERQSAEVVVPEFVRALRDLLACTPQ